MDVGKADPIKEAIALNTSPLRTAGRGVVVFEAVLNAQMARPNEVLFALAASELSLRLIDGSISVEPASRLVSTEAV